MSKIHTIELLWHAANGIWTCAEPGFRLSWMNLCSSNNHYTRATWLPLNRRLNNSGLIYQHIIYKVQIQWIHHPELTSFWCLYYVDTSKIYYHQISPSFRCIFLTQFWWAKNWHWFDVLFWCNFDERKIDI